MTGAPAIQAFFDEPTNTVSYLVSDPATRRAAVIDPVLDYDHRTGKASAKSADAILERGSGRQPHDRVGAGDACPCRPPVRRPLREAQDRREGRHRRAHPRGAEDLPAGVQCHGRRRGRQRVRPSLQGRRTLPARVARDRSAARAWPHPGRHRLQGRRCRLCRRHAVHARLRHGACGLSRRQRTHALPLHQEAAVASARDAPVHVP